VVGKDEPAPLARESFKNNADRLVFADRHEYRTRSRTEALVYGLVSLLTLTGAYGLVAWLMLAGAARSPPPDNHPGVMEYLIASMALVVSPFFLWVIFYGFTFRPRLIVSPMGLDFREWIPKPFRFRRGNFRVEIADITAVKIVSKGEAGQRGNRATTSQHSVQISANWQDEDLTLPWRTYAIEEAQRFMVAFAESIQEMVNRTPAGPFR
jgi:hypothetical protein